MKARPRANFLMLPDSPGIVLAVLLKEGFESAVEEFRRIGRERMDAAHAKARIIQGYIDAQRAIDSLRKELDRMIATTPVGQYSLLDVHAQWLDTLEVSIINHRTTWEFQSAETEAS